jgi:hypothetical protein
MEDMASLYSQYLKICKQDDDTIREFNDRFNTLIGRIDSDFNQRTLFLDSTSIILKENSNPSSGTNSQQKLRRHNMVLVGFKKISNGVIPFPRSILFRTKMMSYGSMRNKNMISKRY